MFPVPKYILKKNNEGEQQHVQNKQDKQKKKKLKQEKKLNKLKKMRERKWIFDEQKKQRAKELGVVPISGLILSRFHQLYNECRTVLELWGDNQ